MRRMIRKGWFGGQGGFTLFEIVMVLLILGIISYFAATRLFSDDVPTQAAELELVKNHLRYAQSRAMNTDSSWGIKFVSPRRYWLFKGDNPDTGRVPLPNIEDLIKRVQGAPDDGSMTLSAINIPDQVVKFDAFGSPGETTVIISTSAGNITVTRNTGFIP